MLYRTDRPARVCDRTAMPRYSFSLEDGVAVTHPDATEVLPSDEAAVQHARLLAGDLARSMRATEKSRVVVRDEAGKEIGAVSLPNEFS